MLADLSSKIKKTVQHIGKVIASKRIMVKIKTIVIKKENSSKFC